MQEYVCGFLFSDDRSRVVLIRKRRPAWQAGKLNGVGGKVEPPETLIDAMHREFWEEAGVRDLDWNHILTLTGDAGVEGKWRGHFFRAFGDVRSVRSVTDESLEVHPVDPLPADTIANLHWMIRMILDDEVAGGVYRVQTAEPVQFNRPQDFDPTAHGVR